MGKNVIFSDSNDVLKQERETAMRAGAAMQLRSLSAVTSDFKPDMQFCDGLAVMALSEKASDVAKAKAERVQKAYEELGVKFFPSVSELLKSAEAAPKKQTDVVEGVDTPDSGGIGTVEDMKSVATKRKGKAGK